MNHQLKCNSAIILLAIYADLQIVAIMPASLSLRGGNLIRTSVKFPPFFCA